ncbi:MAG TPA: hypothetical protein VIA63_02465 [Candidatus Limnocylindria bacterium]|jgi:hypothetical protein
MRFLERSCDRREAAYLAGSGRLSIGERIDIERHAIGCSDCADALRNARPVDVALRTAFAPLRERRTIVAPGRVRMAVGYRRPAATGWLRMPRIFGRLAEVSVMVGVTMFAVGSAIEAPAQQPAPAEEHSILQAYFRAQPPFDEIDYFRWLRLVKPDGTTETDATRLPVGGKFDAEPAEILKAPSASPR